MCRLVAFFPLLKIGTATMNKLAAVVLSISLIAGCGGRTADPVPTYRPGDEDMSCLELKSEMSHIQQEVNKLIPETKKTGKNVALGAAGLFLIFPVRTAA
jgi:hypothetical protein